MAQPQGQPEGGQGKSSPESEGPQEESPRLEQGQSTLAHRPPLFACCRALVSHPIHTGWLVRKAACQRGSDAPAL